MGRIGIGIGIPFNSVGGTSSPVVTQPIIATGSYTGNRPNGETQDIQRISLDFTPDLVIVVPETTQEVCWRDLHVWHGKSQFFDSLSSSYEILPYYGRKSDRFNGNGFAVYESLNINGAVYRYIAIKDNGSGLYQSNSWIGNSASGRTVNWTTFEPDLVIIKRDGGTLGLADRPAIFKFNGESYSVWGKYQTGNSNVVSAVTSNGVTLGDNRQTNENAPPALGEGISGLAFKQNDYFEILTYTGTGSVQLQTLSFNPDFVMLLDTVNDNTANTVRHSIWVNGMAASRTKPFDNTALQNPGLFSIAGSNVLISANASVNGREYKILAFRNNVATEQTIVPSTAQGTNALQLTRDSGHVQLANTSIGSNASTLEWYGRCFFPVSTDSSDLFLPLMLLGDGDIEEAPNTYNGGLFLAEVDPDGNQWDGWSIRWIQNDRLIVDRNDPYNNINVYSLNSAEVVTHGKDVHIILTHDGSGHWQLYRDGIKVKDYNYSASDMDVTGTGVEDLTVFAPDGGAGVSHETYLNALFNDPTASNEGHVEVYKASIWTTTELTDTQARERYNQTVKNGSYTGAAATHEYDFRGGTDPSGATVTNGTYATRDTSDVYPKESKLVGIHNSINDGTGINITSYTVTNGIPSAGQYVVAVSTIRQANTPTITSVTINSTAQTKIENSTYTGGYGGEVAYYLVDASAASNIVVACQTALYVDVAVWQADEVQTGQTTYFGVENASSAIDNVDLASVPKGYNVYSIGTYTGGSNRTAARPQYQDGMIMDSFVNVGSSSRSFAGFGWSHGFNPLRVTLNYQDNNAANVVSACAFKRL